MTRVVPVETAFKERLVADVNRRGLCNQPGADPDDWHPVNTHITPKMAAALCHGCPVVTACKEVALRDEERLPSHGVFGALDPKTRRDLIVRRQKARAERAAELAAELTAQVVELDPPAFTPDTAAEAVQREVAA